jgi:hypothetical protein
MNLLTIGNLTINLDNVAYWTVQPKTSGSTSPTQPPDDPVITFHFIGNAEPVSLFPPMGALFLSFANANLGIKSIQH